MIRQRKIQRKARDCVRSLRFMPNMDAAPRCWTHRRATSTPPAFTRKGAGVSLPTCTRHSQTRSADPDRIAAQHQLAAYGEARKQQLAEWLRVVTEARRAKVTWAEIGQLTGEPEETVRQRARRAGVR